MADRLAPPVNAEGALTRHLPAGSYKTRCPVCSHTRKKKHDPCLHFTSEEDGGAVWKCYNCGWTGGLKGHSRATPEEKRRHKRDRPRNRPDVTPEPLTAGALKWLTEKRGITADVLERAGVFSKRVWFPQLASEQPAIGYPYRRGGVVLNIKWRGPKKSFRQERDAEKTMYGLDDCAGHDEVVIAEGEMDKLAFAVAGVWHCISLPDGAPPQLSDQLPPREDDQRFEALWNSMEQLGHVKRWLIATDNDHTGDVLAEEFARRLGKAQCWRVRFPGVGDAPCKDANDCLLENGPEGVLQALKDAEPWPISGIVDLGRYRTRVLNYYHEGLARGVSTGWPSADELMQLWPGAFMLLTGIPGSGKSEWLDALMVNTAEQHGWRWAICSRENTTEDHVRKLVEKYQRAPFFDAAYAHGRERMSALAVEDGLAWVARHFVPIRTENEDRPRVDWVLDRAREALLRYGINGLVFDPWNEFDHARPQHQREDEYLSDVLQRLRNFGQAHDMVVVVVAHPRALENWDGKKSPGLYDIAGGAMFANKCDLAAVVHRDPKARQVTQLLVKKAPRNKAFGKVGTARLLYDEVTGRFSDMDEQEAAE